MSIEDNKRVDVLTRLSEIAWTNFDRRRSYEWKLSLGIWTALTAFIALSLRGNVTTPPKLAFWAVGGLVVGLQVFFLNRVKLANSADQKAALAYEKEVIRALGEPSDWRTVEQAREKARKFWKGYWSFVVHIGITLVLMGAAGCVIYSNRNIEGGKNVSDSGGIFNVLMAMAAISSAIFAGCVWRIVKKTLIHQALLDIERDYRSPQLQYAIGTLWQFYEDNKEKIVEKYEEIRRKEKEWVSEQGKKERFEAQQSTLHYQRKLVSDFYHHLASLYANGILPKDIVYEAWSKEDLRIIPDVIIPIDNKLREVLHGLGPMKENCKLRILYRDSKD